MTARLIDEAERLACRRLDAITELGDPHVTGLVNKLGATRMLGTASAGVSQLIRLDRVRIEAQDVIAGLARSPHSVAIGRGVLDESFRPGEIHLGRTGSRTDEVAPDCQLRGVGL